AGATSTALAWQFLGSALAPLICLPLYHRSAELGFVTAAAGTTAAVALLLARTRPGGWLSRAEARRGRW
ncbi:MAG: hypothetical protein WAL50_08930, partial [Kineosporiaceae bacterium]